MDSNVAKKSAFVAVVGRPSVGKSTLVNRLCGAKVSIVSPVPQTTRNNVRGIVSAERGQLVFVDTPGRHISGKKLNRRLIETADRAQHESDLILYMLDATRKPGAEELSVAASIPQTFVAEKTIVAINKTDLPNADVDEIKNFLKMNLSELDAQRCVSISALTGSGADLLLNMLFDLAGEGPMYYDADCYTDQNVNFRIAEIVREQAIARLRDELPHAIYVEVSDCELKDDKVLNVRAFIRCERESQKGMIVGQGGKMIRSIRLAALKELKEIFDWHIELDLRVKTARDWRQSDAVLKKLL
jgi:GTP-binding protein Era